jgi:UTP-glucose-1-phosphate uridylyltransferase
MMKTTLLIMAAGLGSRYGGDKQIDGLGPNGEILMQYSIFDAIRAGFEKVVFVIKPDHREIIERVCSDIKGIEIAFAYQEFDSIPAFYKIPADRVKPFGTVHAVLCARDVIAEPFAVINADDFYGSDAFCVMNKKLRELKEGEATMVSYRLKNTVSKNGAVTRGVCELSDGKLAGVRETYKITVDENDVIRDDECGILDPESLVSMNMWGFSADIFEKMEESFNEFLRAIPDGEIKAEYALPTMVDKMISNGELFVSVLSTDAVWFGVTYKEDRPCVVSELARMHESGIYPKKLF